MQHEADDSHGCMCPMIGTDDSVWVIPTYWLLWKAGVMLVVTQHMQSSMPAFWPTFMAADAGKRFQVGSEVTGSVALSMYVHA